MTAEYDDDDDDDDCKNPVTGGRLHHNLITTGVILFVKLSEQFQ